MISRLLLIVLTHVYLDNILKRGEKLCSWKTKVTNRSKWRKTIFDVSLKIDNKRREENRKKHEKRHKKK